MEPFLCPPRFLQLGAETKHFFMIMMAFQEADMMTEFRGTTKKMVGFCFLLCFLAASQPNNSCI